MQHPHFTVTELEHFPVLAYTWHCLWDSEKVYLTWQRSWYPSALHLWC